MSSHDAAFEARARELHVQSLGQLSPRVQAQLAQRRRDALQGTAMRPRRGVLPWAGMATAGLALALVVQLHPPSTTPRPSASVATAAPRAPKPVNGRIVDTRMASRDSEAIAPDLSEDPEFYLWLGDLRPADPE